MFAGNSAEKLHLFPREAVPPRPSVARGAEGSWRAHTPSLSAQVYLGEGDGLDREGPGWETVEPLPGAFVINVGDMFEVASNGLYRAPLHRVLANKENPRCSAPFFYNPSHLCTFEPVSGCVSKESPPMYGPVNWGEFRRRRIQGDLADVGKEIQISDFLLQRP